MSYERSNPKLKRKIFIETFKNVTPTELVNGLRDSERKLVPIFGAFVLIWRDSAGLSSKEIRRSKVFTRFSPFYSLIRRYDDFIDQKGEITVLDLKKEPKSRTFLSRLMLSMCEAPVPVNQKRKFIKELGDFRRKEWQIYEAGRKLGGQMDFEQVAKYKLDSCGLNAIMCAKVFEFHFPSLSHEQKQRGRETMVNVLMALQVRDDVKDLLMDRQEETPNYLDSALRSFPEELSKTDKYLKSGSSGLDLAVLRDLAPSAFALCDREFERFIGSVPESLSEIVTLNRSRYYDLDKIAS